MEDAKAKYNRPENGGQPGVYGHPFVTQKLVVTSFPQADALLRQGWTWESELPKGEKPQESGNENDLAPSSANDVARLEAELAAAKADLVAARAQAQANAKSEKELSTSAANETVEREEARQNLAEAQSKSTEKVAEAKKETK